MKRKKILFYLLVFVCLACISVGVVAIATEDEKIAAIGSYGMTVDEVNTYSIITLIENKEYNSLDEVLNTFAQTQIALSEISGTKYDLSKERKNIIIREEEESFKADYETNKAFCEKAGISEKELIKALATIRFNSSVKMNHMLMVTDEYMENNKDTIPTADELLTVYEEYMRDKTQGLKIEKKNIKKLDQVESKIKNVTWEFLPS